MIKEMTAADIPAALRIDNAAFGKPWSEQDFADELAKDYAYYFICDNGYAGIWCIYETAELIRIAAEKPRQGTGAALMGTLLNSAAEQGCERIMLEVRAGNAPARAMYEKFGFRQISVRHGYYDGEDALIMERTLQHGRYINTRY